MDIELEREREIIRLEENYLIKKRKGEKPTQEEIMAFVDNRRGNVVAKATIDYLNELKGRY